MTERPYHTARRVGKQNICSLHCQDLNPEWDELKRHIRAPNRPRRPTPDWKMGRKWNLIPIYVRPDTSVNIVYSPGGHVVSSGGLVSDMMGRTAPMQEVITVSCANWSLNSWEQSDARQWTKCRRRGSAYPPLSSSCPGSGQDETPPQCTAGEQLSMWSFRFLKDKDG
ncbi:hypothetical protein GDO78_023145 [Eleutherodactylus coqui]|uniref:Uncharacterized protein n=1 Tax=Eleutherodactylus coqui TaxID=57060 RepID=A0A8J6EFK5_ELECQ|nr:hypothetical protein GDO78_023145 [Eleutherodactylus coqui]